MSTAAAASTNISWTCPWTSRLTNCLPGRQTLPDSCADSTDNGKLLGRQFSFSALLHTTINPGKHVRYRWLFDMVEYIRNARRHTITCWCVRGVGFLRSTDRPSRIIGRCVHANRRGSSVAVQAVNVRSNPHRWPQPVAHTACSHRNNRQLAVTQVRRDYRIP